MSLLDQIKQDQLTARKSKDVITSSILTTLIGEASIIGKNDGNRESTDSEVTATIQKFVKNINETLSVQPNPTLESERAILEKYLPTQLTYDQLYAILKQWVITDSIENMGELMKKLKTDYNGQYDGKEASTIIKQLLS